MEPDQLRHGRRAGRAEGGPGGRDRRAAEDDRPRHPAAGGDAPAGRGVPLQQRPQVSPPHPANKLRGSIGRTQSCNFALWTVGVEEDRREAGPRATSTSFFAEHKFIEMGRKRHYPHESWYPTAPYYYYFGHYYAARLLEKLGDGARRSTASGWRSRSCRFRNRTGRGGTTRCGTTTSPTGPRSRIMTLLRCRVAARERNADRSSNVCAYET